MPVVQFEGDNFVFVTPQLAGIAKRDLGPSVGSLARQRDLIIAAVDFLITGF